MEENRVWRDRKRPFLGLPLSFTVYSLTNEKLLVETGFFNKKEDEIRLYRIMDITLNRSFGERLLGLGTIHCCTADKSSPELDIKLIRKPKYVKELLSRLVEDERMAKRVAGREYMAGDDGGDLDMDEDDIDDDDFDHEI